MKKLLIVLIGLPLLVVALLIGASVYTVQSGIASRTDLEFLFDHARRDGIMAAYSTVKTHLYGVDMSNVADPSYDREQIAGRGHAPWVIRGNLDERPRILKFALAPNTWAAYDTESASLYQVWDGDIEFAGAAYDYRHGPQPTSRGNAYARDPEGSRWFIEVDGEEQPASVRYLGHEYGAGRATAGMRFTVSTGDLTLELTEWPEIDGTEGERSLLRQFRGGTNTEGATAGFYTGTGERHLANGTVTIALGATTPINPPSGPDRGREAGDDELSRGEQVIANSDCLGCHGETHPISGPAWSQVSGKFRGKIQEEVVSSLATKVIDGGMGNWGTIIMPGHPDMSMEDARAAVTYILSIPPQEADPAPPLDENGEPYVATRRFDVLPRPESLHPSFALENLEPEGFEPKVGGLAFRDDGKLLVATWDTDGAVYLVTPDAPAETRVKRIAEGLHEPLGITVVDDRIFVLQKQELTELIDTDGDGFMDRYRAHSYDWRANSNFHSFAFGLEHRDDAFYFLLSICVLPGGASCPDQFESQGKLMQVDMAGNTSYYASGFRTPNGIALGPDGELYVTDNQGDYLPSSKLVRVRADEFYGSRAVPGEGVMELVEVPPAAWLPQDEIGNSPTEPMFLTEGPYAGQAIFGDVYNGGIKRTFLEEVDGVLQGAAFHFTAGLQGPVNRLKRGADDAIYIGIVGNPPNWGEFGKPWHGLQRMTWQGNNAFEMRTLRATPNGFLIEFTQPLQGELRAADLLFKQWFYRPNEQYGGPKFDESVLAAETVTLSDDKLSAEVTVPGLKPGYVVYLRLPETLKSTTGNALWTREAWYTLNNIPASMPLASLSPTLQADGWRDLFDGETLDGWRNYGGDENDVRKWVVEDGTLTLTQDGAFPAWDMIKSAVFGGGSGDLIYYREAFKDFELSLEWKISENGNSGIFYLVRDEMAKNPWLTGIEMQVLHNEGHKDGQIKTHRAGDLYDMKSAEPETVKPPGEWNKVRIRIKDNEIEHWLNDVKVMTIVRGSEEWDALIAKSKFADWEEFGKSDTGYIVLQDHGDPVWYRNIRIRAL